MAFSTQASVLAALPGHQLDVWKSTLTTGTGVVFYSYWGVAGWPAAGADPSSGLNGDIPTSATTGAIPFNDAGAGNSLYVARALATLTGGAFGAGMAVYVYDRLWQNSGISATSTSSQAITSTALTRPDANGNNAELWYQVYAAMGSGTPSVTVTYTNPAGTGSRSTGGLAMTASQVVGRTGPFPLQSGDNGVKSIQAWIANASFVSGTIGLVIRRQLTMVPASMFRTAGSFGAVDNVGCGLTKVPNGACLELIGFPSTSISLGLALSLRLAEG